MSRSAVLFSVGFMQARSVYLFLFVTGSALAFLKTLLAARALSVAEFGQFSLLLVTAAILTYASSLGILDAFLVRLNRSRGGAEERIIFRDSGVIANFCLSVVTSLVAVIAIWDFGFVEGAQTAVLAYLFLVGTNCVNCLMIEVQADQRPVEYAACLAAKSAVPASILMTGSEWTIGHILAFELIAIILAVGFLLWRSGVPAPKNFSIAHVRVLVREGSPFTGNAAALNVANNLDKWTVGIAAGANQLGLYAFGAQLVPMGMAFASMVQIYMYPRIIAEASSRTSSGHLLRRVLGLSGVCAVLCAIGIILVVLMASMFVPRAFPQYSAALSIVPVLGVAAIVIGANHVEVIYRLADRGKEYFLIQLAVLVLTGLAYACLVFRDASLVAFALVFLMGRVAQAIFGFVHAARIRRYPT